MCCHVQCGIDYRCVYRVQCGITGACIVPSVGLQVLATVSSVGL